MKKILLASTLAIMVGGFSQVAANQVAPTKLEPVSVFDSGIYSGLFSNQQIRDIFSDKSLIEQWLKVEVALAKSQAQLGIIPQSAADAIVKVAKYENIDVAKLQASTNKVGRGIKGLTDQLKKAEDKQVSAYLHLGTTTQDIMDSATSMQIRDAIKITKSNIKKVIDVIIKKADEHKNTVMIARSNGQDAIPTTFGLHLTTYIAELSRHYTRLSEIEGRLSVQFGSTVGTLAPFGNKGLQLQKLVAEKLDLNVPLAAWNPSRDNFAETVQTLALINATFGRLAIDINTLGRTQINEVQEGESGASSTMPQKRNPRAAEFMGGFAGMAKMYNSAAPDMMLHNDARQGSPWIIEWSVIPESFMVANVALNRAERMFNKLIVNKDKMLENFKASHNYVMAEAVMNELASELGRGKAYSLVKAAIKNAKKDTDLSDVLRTDKVLSKYFDEKRIAKVMNPQNYLGESAKMVENTIKQVQKTVK